MKTLRGLYVFTLGVVGLPWFALFVACLYIWGLVVAVKNKDINSFSAVHEGIKDGTRVGMANLKLFVKYGRNYGNNKVVEEL